jgi:uncharacterized protein YutE (UPF0331/DUF86 family)
MKDLARRIAAEKENIEKALQYLAEARTRKDRSAVELAAIATFLHNIYNGMENILKQVAKAKGVAFGGSPTWHKDLLDFAASSGIIPEELSDRLYEYLTFRHFFVHGYGFMLEEAPLEHLACDIPTIWQEFGSAIERYCRDLDATA